MRKPNPKPEWIQPGDVVDYHSIIGGPVSHAGLRVLNGPELLSGHTWVVWLEGHRGCVAVDACTPAQQRGTDAA